MMNRRAKSMRWAGSAPYFLAGIFVASLLTPANAQRRGFQLPENVEAREVVIWSDGTRMAGDVYSPKGIGADDKLPAVILSHGWGGTKAAIDWYNEHLK